MKRDLLLSGSEFSQKKKKKEITLPYHNPEDWSFEMSPRTRPTGFSLSGHISDTHPTQLSSEFLLDWFLFILTFQNKIAPVFVLVTSEKPVPLVLKNWISVNTFSICTFVRQFAVPYEQLFLLIPSL